MELKQKEIQEAKEFFLGIHSKYESKDNISKIAADPVKGLQLYREVFSSKNSNDISLDNLYKVYPNGVQAITNLNLGIKPKEFVCLLGPSGCGKSTLLRMIAGLEDISSGNLKFGSEIMNSATPSERSLSMVFQNYALYPYMNVYKNISFGLKIAKKKNPTTKLMNFLIKQSANPRMLEISDTKDEIQYNKSKNAVKINELKEELRLSKFKRSEGKSKTSQLKKSISELKEEQSAHANASKELIATLKTKLSELVATSKSEVNTEEKRKLKEVRSWLTTLNGKTIDSRVREVAETVGISDYIKRKPSELSGGQRQRVALARTISKDTRLFLFDEPLSNLDAKLRGGMRELIRKLHDEMGSTSIYVTHDQIEAMTMADKVVVMKTGFIQQVDSPINLYSNPANLFVARFIGTPEMNIIKTQVNEKGEMRFGDSIVKIPAYRIMEKKKNVYFGIRPQHIITSPSIVSEETENVFKGTILNSQLLGNEYLVKVIHPDLGEISVITDTYTEPKVGNQIDFYIKPSRIHLFDEESERTITSKQSVETLESLDNWDSGIKDRDINAAIIKRQKEKTTLTEKIIKKVKNVKKN